MRCYCSRLPIEQRPSYAHCSWDCFINEYDDYYTIVIEGGEEVWYRTSATEAISAVKCIEAFWTRVRQSRAQRTIAKWWFFVRTQLPHYSIKCAAKR